MITTYAAWCRRQASSCACFHVAIPALVLALLAVWGVIEFVTRFALVIEHAALALAGGLAGTGITYLVLACGELRHRRWLRARCADCGTACAVAEVTYANGLRGDTVRTCGGCWRDAERAAGTAVSWDVDGSGPGLPKITPEVLPRLPAARVPPPAPDNVAASAPLPPELAAYEPGITPPSAWTRGHP